MARVLNNEKYEALVYDTSAQIAGKDHRTIIPALRKYITDHGQSLEEFSDLIEGVEFATRYMHRENFRGHQVDEGVYEQIKDIMRIIHDKDIYDGEAEKLPMHKMHPTTYVLLCGRQDNPVFTLGHGCSIYWKDVDCPDCLAKKPESET